MRRGSITIFLSLSLAALLSLLLTVIEGARISAVRMRLMCAADIGMNSVLAEYHRELLEQYDLLFVDTSYGGRAPSIANAEEHLRNYIQKNLKVQKKEGFSFGKDFLEMQVSDVKITEYSLAADEEGGVLKRQAADYMSDYPVEKLLGELTQHLAQSDQYQLETRNTDAEREEYQARIEEIELPKEEIEDGVWEEIPLDNPADAANATRSMGVLNLVVEDIGSISTVKTNLGEYISNRRPQKGTGICKEAVDVSGAPNEILFLAYLSDKCGYYGKEKEASLMRYQIEYMIAGRDTDWQNLEQVCKRLLHWREAANVCYILSDSEKRAEAEAMALALTAVALCPELAEPVKYTILFAWAYVESLRDVKILLEGGKVPIYKTAADWNTGIDSIKNVKGSLSGAEKNGRGLTYKQYLDMMLFLTNAHDRTFRAMDLMEMDIRKTPGNSAFQIDGCFDAYRAEISAVSGFGYHCEAKPLYGFY